MRFLKSFTVLFVLAFVSVVSLGSAVAAPSGEDAAPPTPLRDKEGITYTYIVPEGWQATPSESVTKISVKRNDDKKAGMSCILVENDEDAVLDDYSSLVYSHTLERLRKSWKDVVAGQVKVLDPEKGSMGFSVSYLGTKDEKHLEYHLMDYTAPDGGPFLRCSVYGSVQDKRFLVESINLLFKSFRS